MKTVKVDWLQLVVLAAPFCVAALLWDKLPDRVPIHWNIHGRPDGYAGRAMGSLLLPCTNLLMVAIVGAAAKIDPRLRRQDPETHAASLRVIRRIRLAISLFFAVMSLTVLGISAGLALDMSRIIWLGLALLFLVLGNVMGKIRPNYFIGVRTAWTLESREVWQKTHRLAGKVMVAGSMVLALGALTFRPESCVWFSLSVIILIALVPVVYSYVAYKKEQPA